MLQPENVSDPYALSDKTYGQHGPCEAETGRRLIKGEWNKGQSDRTGWYTFTPYGRKVMEESEDEDYA